MTAPRLVVEGVTQRYGRGAAATTVLHGVDLHAGAGRLVALSGRSGSGKSTLCHLAAGLEDPTQGRVQVDGRSPRGAAWSTVAVLPQRLGLADELTVQENVTLPLRLGAQADGTGTALLEALDLDRLAGRRAGETSLGEQQRTGVARTLVLGPRLAVLDEPTAHQDDARLALVLAVLRAGRPTPAAPSSSRPTTPACSTSPTGWSAWRTAAWWAGDAASRRCAPGRSPADSPGPRSMPESAPMDVRRPLSRSLLPEVQAWAERQFAQWGVDPAYAAQWLHRGAELLGEHEGVAVLSYDAEDRLFSVDVWRGTTLVFGMDDLL